MKNQKIVFLAQQAQAQLPQRISPQQQFIEQPVERDSGLSEHKKYHLKKRTPQFDSQSPNIANGSRLSDQKKADFQIQGEKVVQTSKQKLQKQIEQKQAQQQPINQNNTNIQLMQSNQYDFQNRDLLIFTGEKNIMKSNRSEEDFEQQGKKYFQVEIQNKAVIAAGTQTNISPNLEIISNNNRISRHIESASDYSSRQVHSPLFQASGFRVGENTYSPINADMKNVQSNNNNQIVKYQQKVEVHNQNKKVAEKQFSFQKCNQKIQPKNNQINLDENNDKVFTFDSQEKLDNDSLSIKQEDSIKSLKKNKNYTSDDKKQQNISDSNKKHEKNQEILKEGNFQKNRGKTSGMSHQQNERSIKEKLQIKQKKGSSMELIQNETNQDQINDSKRLSLLNSTTNQFDQSNKSSFTNKNIGQIKVKKKYNNIKNNNNYQTLEDINSTEKQNYHSFAMIEIANTKDMINNQTINMIFQKQSPKLSPFEHTSRNNNPLIIVSKDTDSECFSDQLNQIDGDQSQQQFAVINYSQAFKAMENIMQAPSYNQFLIDKLKKQARKELIKNSNKILSKQELIQLKNKLINQKLKQISKKKENNSFGKLSNQSRSESESADSIAQIQIEFEERQRIQHEKDRLIVEQRTKIKQKQLKLKLQQTMEQISPRNKNKFDKRVRYGAVLKNNNSFLNQKASQYQTKQNMHTNYIQLKEKMGSSLKQSKIDKDYDVQTNRLNDVFEIKSHDEKNFKQFLNDDANKNKIQTQIEFPDSIKKMLSDEQFKIQKIINQEEPLNYQFIQIKKIEMPFMNQQKSKIEMQIGPLNQKEQSKKIKLEVNKEIRYRINTVNHHESLQNSQYFKEQQAFNTTRQIARKINQRVSQPPSMEERGHLINIDEVCGSFDTEKVQKSMLNQSNSLKNGSVSHPRNFQINIQADGKLSPKLGQIISIIQQESRQNLLNNSIVQESEQKLTSNYKQREYDSLVSLSREQNLNKINSSQIINQILYSENKTKKDGDNTVETENNQLLIQQNQLHQDQEHQEQLFRNIQLMQQSLKEKEEKRIKKKKLLNQDIPLQHKESSGSNKIKSNILQIYLQSSQNKLMTNKSTPRENNQDVRPSTSVSEKELDNLQAIQLKHYQEIRNLKQVKQNFKELDISDKLQIQKNLQDMQQKLQSKNMNTHYKRQKMPFNHFRHPGQNSLLKKPKMIKIQHNLSLQGHAAIIEIHSPTGIKSKGYKLSQGSRNSNKQKESDISQQIEIIMKMDKDKQLNQQNIMPAPVQNNLQDSFHNRIIKNKIIENVQLPTPGDYGSYNSLENLHRSIILSQESDKTLRQELIVSNSPRHSTIKSFGRLSNKSKITEKMFIMNEIKDIEQQLLNLQKVYDKNKNILRKMKDQKLNKLYTLNTSRRDSVNSNSNLSNENESMKSKYSQSGSPRKKELLEQQIEILKKQEELKQTLIKSQRKNLQIQQRLIQKIDIQKKTILLLEEQVNQQDNQKIIQSNINQDISNKNFIDQSKQKLKQIESNIQKMMSHNQYVISQRQKQKDKKKEQKQYIIQKEEENLLKKISLLQSLYKTLNLVKMNQMKDQCIQIEDKQSNKQQMSQMSKTLASKFLTRNEKFNSGDVNSQQSQDFESALQIREMMKTNLLRQESTNQQYTGHSQLDKQNLFEKVNTIRSKEGSLKSQIKLSIQEKLYESGEYIANQNSNQIYSTFTNKEKCHIKNVDQQAQNLLTKNRNYSLNQDLQISSRDQNLVNDSQHTSKVQHIHKMQSANTDRIEDETITKEQESLAYLNEQKPLQISDQILKTSKGSIINQSQNEKRNLVSQSIMKSIKIEKTEKRKQESQKVNQVDQSFKSQIKVKKNDALQQFQSIFEKQTPQEIRKLISNMTLIIDNTSQYKVNKNQQSYDYIEIIGKHVKVENKDKLNQQMEEKLKIIKQIEKSFINFHFNQNQDQSNVIYEKEDAYEIANKLDQSLERIEKQNGQLQKNENSFESSHFQPNVRLVEQDSRNITTNQDESNQESFSPRSNIRDIFKYSSTKNQSKEGISFHLNPQQVKILNNDSKEQVSYLVENALHSDNKLEEMDIFIDKFMNYYKDMNSIQKLRDIVIQSQKKIDSNHQFALFDQTTPRQTILIELYDKILEDLEKLLFLDIQNILETSTHLEEEINIYQKLKKKQPDKKQINLNQNDHLYINQTHITKNNIQQDLYYQLRTKVHKENYIRHVENKLTDQITNIEKQSKAQRDTLIKNGGLFKDDLQNKQNPTVPLIYQLTDKQFMEGNIDEIKNLKHDNQLTITEKQKLRKEFNEIKYQKLQKKREQYLDENLSSEKSTHQHSQNDLSNEQYIPKIKSEKLKKMKIKNIENNKNNPLILTNESLQNVIATSETLNYPQAKQKESNTQQLMKNGFEMSVQKLAKVNTHDRDSLMSSKNSKAEDKTNNFSSFTPTNQQVTRAKIDLENYFISKQWIKQNQNIQGNQTAPGGIREKILSEQQVDNQQLSYKLQDIKSQNVNQDKSNMVSVIENNVFSHRAKSINKKQRQNAGLIQRDDILYKNVLSFNNQSIKKSDFQNNDNNQQLNLIREKLKARIQQPFSTTVSLNQQLPFISEDQPSFKVDIQSKHFDNERKSQTNSTFQKNQIKQLQKSQLNNKLLSDRMNTAVLSQRKSDNQTVQRSENTENILMLKDLKSSFISSKMASGIQKKDYSNNINFFGYGDQIIKMGATQQQNFENKYFKYLQYDKPILPALNFILKEQIRQNMDNQNSQEEKKQKIENENLYKEQNRVIDSMHDSSYFQYHLLLEKQKQNKTEFKMVEDIKLESETNKNIRRLMNGQSVIRNRDEGDKSLIRNAKALKQRKSSYQQAAKLTYKPNILFTDKTTLQALFQQETRKVINNPISSRFSKSKQNNDLIQIEQGYQHYQTIQQEPINLKAESVFKFKANKLKSTEQISQELSNDDQHKKFIDGSENIKIGQMNIEGTFDKEKTLNTQNQSLISIQRNDECKEKSLIDRIINSQMDQQLIQKHIFEQKIWNKKNGSIDEENDSDEKFKDFIKPLQFKFFNEIFQNKNNNLVKQPSNIQKLKFNDHLQKFQEIKTHDMVKQRSLL